MNTVTEFRAEVLHLKCSFESVMDTTKKALAGVSEFSKVPRNPWEPAHEMGGYMEETLEGMKAELGQAMQELFTGLWESHSAALIRKQEESHEKLTALVAHVIGEQVVSVSGAALAMALRKDVGAIRLENEQLQKQVAQMAGQLHTQIEDLELRAMLHESARRPDNCEGSLAFEMQRSGPCMDCDNLSRQVCTLREDITLLHQNLEGYFPECSRLREEIDVMKSSISIEKKMRGLTRLECDEVSERLDEQIMQTSYCCSGCVALRREFEALKHGRDGA